MKFLKLLWEGWKKVGMKIADFVSALVLTLFYVLVVTPYALVMKVFSDPLDIKKIPSLSGWKTNKPAADTIEKAHRQY